ncbi:MAG: cation:proton antiporter [Elusimicrobia bacterium]|nr:cation:proton antiporter [Elusimicrobiota bacterium]
MQLMTSLLFLLVTARVAGELAERLRQPAMIGEIAAGILLGPSLLGWVAMSPELKGIADLGVFLLVLLAGMEIDFDELRRAFSGRGTWVAAVGFFLPLVLGAGVGAAFGKDATRCLFLGLCVAITALPVSVRILMDLKRLESDVGRRIVSAAVANDVCSMLILGIVLNVKDGSTGWLALAGGVALSLVKAAAFLAAVVAAHRLVRYGTGFAPVSRRLLDRLLAALKGKETLFAFAILFVLIFASLSESIGLHGVIGAFFGSALLGREFLGHEHFEEVQKTASGITMGFLAPIFFATIGLNFDARQLTNAGLILAVLTAAFVGKILGGYWGGRLAGLGLEESWALGYGLNGRGIMELVIAEIALSNGFIGQEIFSILVLMGVVTTLVTPALLGRALARLDAVSTPEAAAS